MPTSVQVAHSRKAWLLHRLMPDEHAGAQGATRIARNSAEVFVR